MDNRPIGVFDSGLGGLNVLKELMLKMPNEKYIYLGDTARFPYGQKSKEAIIEISKQNIEFLISKNVKMIIIACGTATSQALEEVKRLYDVPIVGIIEPTVINLKKIVGKKEEIGVIATKGTIRSGEWEKKIHELIPEATIISQEAPLLATMAEEGWINNNVAKYTIKEYMKLFKNVDKLILGCTHYPLFSDLMKNELPKKTKLIDVGMELSEFINDKYYDLKCEESNKGGCELYLTDIDENFVKIASLILNTKISIKDLNKVEL